MSMHGIDRRSVLQLSKSVLAVQLERLATGVEYYVDHSVAQTGLDRRNVLQFSQDVLSAQQEQLLEGAEVIAPDPPPFYLLTSG